jgi:hypothetical protein
VPASRHLAALLLATTIPLAACSRQEDDAAKAAPEAAQAPATGGVVRAETPAPEAPVQRMPAQTPIQSQPGPDGSQVDLMKVAVTGDILTVSMRCSSDQSFNSESFQISNISVVEDATSQRLSVLRDNAGVAMVSDFNRSSGPEHDQLGAECGKKGGVIWAKFPAPSPSSPTVSINFPGVGPFDGIPVTR